MNFFESHTQYDDKYKELAKIGVTKSSCPLFALLSAYNFMNSPTNVDQATHKRNVDLGVEKFACSGLEGELTFQEMLTFTDLNNSNVIATSIELIKTGVLSFDQMFKPVFTDPYCIIFLKNSKFFVVMVRPDMFCVRDCHEMFQYNFSTLDEMVSKLQETYQFVDDINLDGYMIPEFSRVEFLVIDKKFKCHLETDSPGYDDNTYDQDHFDNLDVDYGEIEDISEDEQEINL